MKFGGLAALAAAHLGLFRWERTAVPTKTGVDIVSKFWCVRYTELNNVSGATCTASRVTCYELTVKQLFQPRWRALNFSIQADSSTRVTM